MLAGFLCIFDIIYITQTDRANSISKTLNSVHSINSMKTFKTVFFQIILEIVKWLKRTYNRKLKSKRGDNPTEYTIIKINKPKIRNNKTWLVQRF